MFISYENNDHELVDFECAGAVDKPGLSLFISKYMSWITQYLRIPLALTFNRSFSGFNYQEFHSQSQKSCKWLINLVGHLDNTVIDPLVSAIIIILALKNFEIFPFYYDYMDHYLANKFPLIFIYEHKELCVRIKGYKNKIY